MGRALDVRAAWWPSTSSPSGPAWWEWRCDKPGSPAGNQGPAARRRSARHATAPAGGRCPGHGGPAADRPGAVAARPSPQSADRAGNRVPHRGGAGWRRRGAAPGAAEPRLRLHRLPARAPPSPGVQPLRAGGGDRRELRCGGRPAGGQRHRLRHRRRAAGLLRALRQLCRARMPSRAEPSQPAEKCAGAAAAPIPAASAARPDSPSSPAATAAGIMAAPSVAAARP